MAKYVPIGQPINRAEENGIRALRDHLPEHYVIIGSFDLKLEGRANSLEFDAVIIAEHCLYAIEIKGWSGKIEAKQNRWMLEWGALADPFIHLEKKAKALRSFLGAQVKDFPNVPVEAIVFLPRAPVLGSAFVRRKDILCETHEIIERLASEKLIYRLGPGPFLDPNLREKVLEALVPRAKPSRELMVVSDYEILGEIEQKNRAFREFVGRHKLLRSRNRVRIKLYSLDALSSQTHAFDHVLRDMEAITELEENPYVARGYDIIRDLNDELNFYLVGEWVSSRTLESTILSGEKIYFDEEHDLSIRRIAKHLLLAIDFMHKKGILHRNLSASVIYITKNKSLPLKIADFEYARISHLPTIIGEESIARGKCLAPELWLSETHDHRVDIYAFGCILFFLFTNKPLCESLGDIADPVLSWKEKSTEILDLKIRKIVGKCLQIEPEKRPAISEILSYFPNS